MRSEMEIERPAARGVRHAWLCSLPGQWETLFFSQQDPTPTGTSLALSLIYCRLRIHTLLAERCYFQNNQMAEVMVNPSLEMLSSLFLTCTILSIGSIAHCSKLILYEVRGFEVQTPAEHVQTRFRISRLAVGKCSPAWDAEKFDEIYHQGSKRQSADSVSATALSECLHQRLCGWKDSAYWPGKQ
jgi:hypothetical protein